MSHLRVRPLEKPLIVQSLTYNHRLQESENSSQASFLKLSQKNSQEFQGNAGLQVFKDVQQRLNRLEAESLIKLHQVQTKISSHKSIGKREEACANRVSADRGDLLMTYRYIQKELQEEDLQACNFEMDENRNYVRHSPHRQNSNFMRPFIDAKEICSEPQVQPLLQRKGSAPKSSKCQSGRSSFRNLSEASPGRQNQRILRTSSVNRKNGVASIGKSSQAGPSSIYKQILSNYSTAKLLAIQKASK